MRYVGIDFGTKRVGVAVSDDGATIAFPYAVFDNDAKLLENIVALIEEYGVAAIVIGHSLDQYAKPNAVQSAIESFMTDLTLQCPTPIHLEPEQYTTQAALRIQGRNEKTDASAAALILDGFLQKQRSQQR